MWEPWSFWLSSYYSVGQGSSPKTRKRGNVRMIKRELIEVYCICRDKTIERRLINLDSVEQIFSSKEQEGCTIISFREPTGITRKKSWYVLVDEPYESLIERIISHQVRPAEIPYSSDRVFSAEEIFGEL